MVPYSSALIGEMGGKILMAVFSQGKRHTPTSPLHVNRELP
jgi:hypothetical protein